MIYCRFTGTAYRAHNPAWSWSPRSGAGAAIRGGRFNRKGRKALYLALDPLTAVAEASHGLSGAMQPLMLCSYELDMEGIVDLSSEAGRHDAEVDLSDMSGDWLGMALNRKSPPSWLLSERLIAAGATGLMVPSYAIDAPADSVNLVLFSWGDDPPTVCKVNDRFSRLPKDATSWE